MFYFFVGIVIVLISGLLLAKFRRQNNGENIYNGYKSKKLLPVIASIAGIYVDDEVEEVYINEYMRYGAPIFLVDLPDHDVMSRKKTIFKTDFTFKMPPYRYGYVENLIRVETARILVNFINTGVLDINTNISLSFFAATGVVIKHEKALKSLEKYIHTQVRKNLRAYFYDIINRKGIGNLIIRATEDKDNNPIELKDMKVLDDDPILVKMDNENHIIITDVDFNLLNKELEKWSK